MRAFLSHASPRVREELKAAAARHVKGGMRLVPVRLDDTPYDGKVSDELIADRLASLSYDAHRQFPETVGPRSVVIWKRRLDARNLKAGGGHLLYTEVNREGASETIPTISGGMDNKEIVDIIWQKFQHGLAEHGPTLQAMEWDDDKLDRRIAAIPDTPDEKLR